MPKSKSKRSNYTPPTPPRPRPSPRWVPVLGLSLIAVGAVVLIAMYLIPGLPGGNLNLIIGFIVMAGGLVTLSRWR